MDQPVSGINRVVLPGRENYDGPNVPESFRDSLRQYDSTLLVTWNARRSRFVIEQCVEHLSGTTEHTFICRRTYVLMAQDDDGSMLPLGEKVLDMVKARDVTRQGFGPGDLDKFLKQAETERVDHAAKTEEKRAGIIRDGRKDNKRQIRKAIHLMQQHNLEVNQ